MALIHLMRPHQWLKNLMLFFPPFLGGILFSPGLLQKGVVPFFAFCLASSATYVVNDILDAEKDAHHPEKKHRPIPAKQVSKRAATCLATVLLVLALLGSIAVSTRFLLIIFAYLLLTFLYSFRLKKIPIIDLFCISAGFLLRLFAGGAVYSIVISEWLFLTVFLLSIFLGTGKRLCEKNILGQGAGSHRKTLNEYPEGYLDGSMYMTGSAVLVTYTMYVIDHPSLIYTVPLCCFGLFRYIFRVKSGKGGDPTESLLKDAQLFVVGLLWVVMVGWGIYIG